MDLGALRRQTLEKIKQEIIKKGVVVYREELKSNIQFTVSGIKECINQPCSNQIFLEKIELLSERLEIALKTAEYVGYTDYQTHPKEHILGYHYFRTEIAGNISVFFNVQYTIQKKFVLYSITEKAHI